MRILHYILGFPPMRSGGLTRYAVDLMEAEISLGHQVTALYPGNFHILSNKSKFKKKKTYREITVYELTNSLPVPLLYGIRYPKDFMAKRVIIGFDEFLREISPDVIHIHTLMGLPVELLRLFKDAGIRMVHTTHDYFGLCPKVNLINKEGCICWDMCNAKCQPCNADAKPTSFLKVRNMECLLSVKSLFRKFLR